MSLRLSLLSTPYLTEIRITCGRPSLQGNSSRMDFKPSALSDYGQIIQKLWSYQTQTDLILINREQDLGVEGLRKAKLSYHPDHMVEKFVICLAH
ncbi:DUF2156 domain-containing protein [candidate division WOR-3 bacterium]|nr:DUF2156 domain-containing protein [candidate division WOR-3 bacterium]